MMTDLDFVALMEPVARHLLGDPNPSLSKPKEFRYGTRGSLSVDLEMGVWYDHEADDGGGLLALIMREIGLSRDAAKQWLSDKGFTGNVGPEPKRVSKLVAIYPYRDEGGALLSEVCRDELKTFRQRRPHPNGRDRIWDMKGVRRVLYRLPELCAAPDGTIVFVTEGEKDADRLSCLNLTATTNSGGAGNWRPEYTEALKGRRVVILADNDQAGRLHASAAKESLDAAGIRGAILELEGLPEKGDVSDWLDAGGTPGRLLELAAEALERDPGPPRPSSFRHDDIELVRDGKGRPVWNAANAVAILGGHPDWQGVLAYDELAARHVILRSLPGGADAAAFPREITDANITVVTAWFNRNGFPRASKNVVVDAVIAVAEEHRFNDCVSYLEGLGWDGVNRLDIWLGRYLGANDSLYVGEVGRRWLVACVARALRPGCKADNMLVLEGPQGVGKSSALRVLTGEAWFGDALPDLRSKDASSYLRGKWIVEVAELNAMRRSDMELQKAFLSRQEERYRPAFGRFEVHEPRRSIFAGTTNRKDYLRDETGGRRFWPVEVGEIDLESLARDRDQLWAEAVAAFRAGEQWWLTGEVEVQARQVQSERHEDDPWMAAVSQYVSGKNEVSCKEILAGQLQLNDNQMGRKESLRVAGLLHRLGFARRGKFTNGEWKDLARYARTAM